MNSGEIVVYIDNKKVLKGIYQNIQKESQYAQEAGTKIEGIRHKIKKASIDINFELEKRVTKK